MKQQILVIVGPTASGKTSLAFEVAALLSRCAVISIDARQAYKELSILTGKDIPSNLPSGTSFYGADLFDTAEDINIATFVKKVQPIIKENLINRTPIILVGGSGLYLKALTSNMSDLFIPPDPILREKLSYLSTIELQQELNKINSDLFNKLNNSDKKNPRRLIRHIEKNLSPKSTLSLEEPQSTFRWIGLSLSKDTQMRRIENRVKERIAQGAIKEVNSLLSAQGNINHSHLFTSLGFREIQSFIRGEISQDTLLSLWTKSEIQYARRQIVWFKKQPQIIWYDESKDRSQLAQELVTIIKQK